MPFDGTPQGRARAALCARIGGSVAAARLGGKQLVQPATAGFRRKFEREADPFGVLDPDERAKRAQHLLRAHMLRLAAKSRDARAGKANR